MIRIAGMSGIICVKVWAKSKQNVRNCCWPADYLLANRTQAVKKDALHLGNCGGSSRCRARFCVPVRSACWDSNNSSSMGRWWAVAVFGAIGIREAEKS